MPYIIVPLVVESTGAWEPGASKTLELLSRAVVARTGSDAGLLHTDPLQEFSVFLRSHHAGAALRRRTDAAPAPIGAPKAPALISVCLPPPGVRSIPSRFRDSGIFCSSRCASFSRLGCGRVPPYSLQAESNISAPCLSIIRLLVLAS